ncbi:MAG: hypothetical protein IJT88_09355 [Kiritimatiellae bacterium]|nr:hypothetical protein [Kiritimatiellia bacterium]
MTTKKKQLLFVEGIRRAGCATQRNKLFLPVVPVVSPSTSERETTVTTIKNNFGLWKMLFSPVVPVVYSSYFERETTMTTNKNNFVYDNCCFHQLSLLFPSQFPKEIIP